MKLIDLGITETDSLEEKKRIRIVNSISLFTLLLLILFALVGCWLENLALILLFAIITPIIMWTPYFSYKGKHQLARSFFLLSSYVIIFCMTLALGPELHTQYFLLAGIGMPLIFISNEKPFLRRTLSLIAIPLFILLAFIFTFDTYQPLVKIESSYQTFLQYFNDFLMFCTVFYMFMIFTKQSDQHIEKIKEQKDSLENKNKQLDQFAYIISHDLKAPLRAIITLVDFIEEDHYEKFEDELKENFDLIKSRAEKMNFLINAVLKYSKAGTENSEFESITIDTLLSGLKLILDRPESVHFNVDDPQRLIQVQRVQLEQVLLNLISNGLKYNKSSKPQVDVDISHSNNSLHFKVKDNGIGIAAENFDKIFDLFMTVEKENEMDSSGIGLSIVQKIISSNGGEIQVFSEIGKGSEFIFSWKV